METLIVLFFWLLFGLTTATIARQKRRSGASWFVVGFLLGPIGLLIILFIRTPHRCPYCKESVHKTAHVCPHCRKDIVPERPGPTGLQIVTAILLIIFGIVLMFVSLSFLNDLSEIDKLSESKASEFRSPQTNNTSKTSDSSVIPEKTVSIYRISASEIWSQYESNEIAADQKYQNKILIVDGRIRSIAKNAFGTIYITLSEKSKMQSYYSIGEFIDLKEREKSGAQEYNDLLEDYVTCFFSDRQVDIIAHLHKNQSVKIQGICRGLWIGSVVLEGCTILN